MTYPDETPLAALPFATCFAYLPAGRGPVYEEGRQLCAHLKAADHGWLPRLAAQVWLETVGHGHFRQALGGRVVLVPVPRSVPGRYTDWIGERLAWCLKQLGLGVEVMPVLRRAHAVKKSAFAAAGERPSVLEHFASLAVDLSPWGEMSARRVICEPLMNDVQLTLIDDVITRGRTLLAAAGRLREAFPGAQVRAFALIRTLGPNETLYRVLEPCEGEVRWISGDARRRP